MGGYILLVILIILSIIGVSEVCRRIIFSMTSEKTSENHLIVIPIKGHCENAEHILRAAAQRMKWIGGCNGQGIICLDCQMDKETRKICELVCFDYDFIKVYSKEDFIKNIEKY